MLGQSRTACSREKWNFIPVFKQKSRSGILIIFSLEQVVMCKALSLLNVNSFLTEEKQYAEAVTESYCSVVDTICSWYYVRSSIWNWHFTWRLLIQEQYVQIGTLYINIKIKLKSLKNLLLTLLMHFLVLLKWK